MSVRPGDQRLRVDVMEMLTNEGVYICGDRAMPDATVVIYSCHGRPGAGPAWLPRNVLRRQWAAQGEATNMMNTVRDPMRLNVRRDPFWNEVEFLLFQNFPSSKAVAIGHPVVFESFDWETIDHAKPPTFKLPDESAQHLMDELWRAGFRPTEGTGSAGALAAVQAHLEDMRRLVFKQPNA